MEKVSELPIYANSVTSDEVSKVSNGGVMRVMVPFMGGLNDANRLTMPPVPPTYWSRSRDMALRSTIHQEAMWAGAIGIAITKMASLSWEIDSQVPRRAKTIQEILLDGGGMGWTGFLSRHLRDFLTTDNGAFVEVIRENHGPFSKIVGIKHLDSLRCTRTGDPDVPVLYTDKLGKIHEMKHYQVMALSDMPDPGDSFFGVGLCAASRAYAQIFKLAAIEWYIREKVSGMRPLAIYIVNGLLDKQIKDAVESARDDQAGRGIAAYMGAVMVGIPSDKAPGVATIPLAELPDRFQRKEEFDIAVLAYADAIGMDVQDLQPLSGQGLGTGTQSNTLANKEKGKGMACWRQGFTHGMNRFVTDDLSNFMFIEKDYRDMLVKAEVSKARVEVAKARIDAAITTPEFETQILVDQDELPKEIMAGREDVTPGDTVSDSDKPDQDNAKIDDAEEKEPVPVPAPAEAEDETTKEVGPDTTMIAFFVDPEASKAIAAATDLRTDYPYHVTLAFLGDTTAEERAVLAKTLSAYAMSNLAVGAVVSGVARFDGDGDGDAVVATVDGKDLSRFRENMLAEAEIEPKSEHGFTAHITLAHIPKDAPTPELKLPRIPLKFSKLSLAWGDGNRIDMPMLGVDVDQEQRDLDDAMAILEGDI